MKTKRKKKTTAEACTNPCAHRKYRLLSPKVQESYYSRIAERYLAFCTDAGDRDELQKQFSRLAISSQTENQTTKAPVAVQSALYMLPTTKISTTTTTTTPPHLGGALPEKKNRQQAADLGQILSALRKLREGIVASKRRDDFAIQVYLFAIRLGVLTAAHETYHPALLYLLRVLHPAHSLTSVELAEVVGYLVLDAACRRADLAEAYALRNRYRLRDAKIDGALRALVTDDWVLWNRVRRSVDAHRASLMATAEPQLRDHLLKAFGRSYLSVGLDFLEAQTLCSWPELRDQYGVGWELNGDRVVIRKIQGRS